MNNKLYAQCREEARKIIYDNIGVSNIKYDLQQLTAEIYGMKLLDMAATGFLPTVASKEVKYWQKDYYQNKDYYYSTKEVHDHFVREFNNQPSKGGEDE